MFLWLEVIALQRKLDCADLQAGLVFIFILLLVE